MDFGDGFGSPFDVACRSGVYDRKKMVSSNPNQCQKNWMLNLDTWRINVIMMIFNFQFQFWNLGTT